VTASIFSERYKRLCALLTEERKRNGLSQQQLAERLGRPQSYVSKYERGERRLDVIEFVEIAEALGRSANSLLRVIINGDT
jgi:transcriptional regulator with XRE-family HTH domain